MLFGILSALKSEGFFLRSIVHRILEYSVNGSKEMQELGSLTVGVLSLP